MAKQIKHYRRSKKGKKFPAGRAKSRARRKTILRVIRKRKARLEELDDEWRNIERRLMRASSKEEVRELARQAAEINKKLDTEAFGNLNTTFDMARQDFVGQRQRQVEKRLFQIRNIKQRMRDQDQINQAVSRQRIHELQNEIEAL